jgi:colanic acid/amylovoran biosynthesis protein
MREIATIGATLSGNKGAASMLLGVLDSLPPLLGDVRVNVLSVYPDEDRRLNSDGRVEIVTARPVGLVLAVPLAALWAFLHWLRLPPGPLRRNPVLAALHRSDVLIDLGGISFSDGRTIELVYNAACVLPALLLRKRVVKYSQAMGPFETALNRSLAKALLPRMALNVARGRRTLSYLQDLGLEDVPVCADAAFSMEEAGTPVARDALPALERFGGRRIVGVSASSVVQRYCQRRGIDYPQVLAGFADQAIQRGYGVWLIAHSVRRSGKAGRTNDVDTCQAVYDLLRDRRYCQLIVEDHDPRTLRSIVGECDFLVASRFHAMVSSLAKGVPTIATSWSHKYAEVLEMFQLGEWTVGHEALTSAALWDRFRQLAASEDAVRRQIARHLPDVVASSREGARRVAQLLSD